MSSAVDVSDFLLSVGFCTGHSLHRRFHAAGLTHLLALRCWTGLDFKIVTACKHGPKFDTWEEHAFTPEGDIVAALKVIDGVSEVETQTYTFMSM